MRKQFTFYHSFYDAIKALPKEDQADLFLAICAYALDDETPQLQGMVDVAFTLIKPVLDTGKRKAAAGAAGGKGKKDRRDARIQKNIEELERASRKREEMRSE